MFSWRMVPCVIFGDEHRLVVAKPAGWNTHAPQPLCRRRHLRLARSINMGMADGHAENVKLQMLWRYEWHRNWNMAVVNR